LGWVWTLLAATATAAALWFRPRAKKTPAPAPAPPAPVARQATPRDHRALNALLRREERRPLSDYWLDAAIAVALALLIVPPIVIARRGAPAVVLIRDLRQGDRIDKGDVTILRLPRLEHTFSSASDVEGRLALHDLQGGSVVRTIDVGRRQAVAAADEVEVPLRAFAGGLAPGAGSEVIVVATPRGNGTPALFEHVRVLSADSTHEPATLLVAMTKADAMRFAALPAADLSLMRQRRDR
jgi:hypothetical protein